MNKLAHLLAKPFPQEESVYETLGIIIGISVFVFLFLYVFQPFGIHQIKSGLFLLCLGFGFVTFAASIVYEVIAVKLLRIKGQRVNFTYGRWILYFLGAMLAISLGNFLFVRLAVIGNIDWSLFPHMVRSTVAIGFFPIVVLGAYALLKQEKKFQDIADAFNQKQSAVSGLSASKGRAIFGIPCCQIRYIEGMQNYIKIGHLDANGIFKEVTERATLKSISDITQGSLVSRCHRSFFVNREFISSISGNAQGLQVSLLDCDKEIPVSRRYIKDFRDN